jgi:hypothetical protein
MKLVWPAQVHLASYVDALERGWTPTICVLKREARSSFGFAKMRTSFLRSRLIGKGVGLPWSFPTGE